MYGGFQYRAHNMAAVVGLEYAVISHAQFRDFENHLATAFVIHYSYK